MPILRSLCCRLAWSLLIVCAAQTALFADQPRTLYVLVVADTPDSSIGDSVRHDGESILACLKKGFADHAEQLEFDTLYEKLSKQKLDEKIDEINKHIRECKGEAAFLLYFSGHGLHDPQDGHALCVGNVLVPRERIRRRMAAANPRLCLLITDSCNCPIDGERGGPNADKPPSWDTLRCLFLESRGMLDINACSKGEYALCDPEGKGSIFTNALIATLYRPFAELDGDKDSFLHWDEVLPLIQKQTRKDFQQFKTATLTAIAKQLQEERDHDEAHFLTTAQARLQQQQDQTIHAWSTPSRRRVGMDCVDRGGVQVGAIEPGSPADRAGLKIGDVLLMIEGRRVENVEQLREYLRRHKGEVTVQYLRPPQEAEQSCTLLLEVWPDLGVERWFICGSSHMDGRTRGRCRQLVRLMGLVLAGREPQRLRHTLRFAVGSPLARNPTATWP